MEKFVKFVYERFLFMMSSMAPHFKSFLKSSQPPDSPSSMDHRCLSCVPGPWVSRDDCTWSLIHHPPPTMNGYMKKTNETTTTTTHKYVWVSMIVFKGTKSLSLFLQRSIRGCYGLNHMPWKSIGSHWLRGFPARLAARGWKQWNCTWWARD